MMYTLIYEKKEEEKIHVDGKSVLLPWYHVEIED